MSDKEVDFYLKELKVNDVDFRSFYKWKNGNDINDISKVRCQIFDFGSMLSLDSIKKLMNKDQSYWNDYFIPIITTGDGDFLLFNNNVKENDYGKLHLFSPSLLIIEEPISYYDSLSKLLETTIIAYNQQILSYDSKEDWVNLDTREYLEIARKINIKSKYWTLIPH